MSGIRINKFLASSGVCSRRAADALIEAGCVLVNGRIADTGLRLSEGDEVKIASPDIFRSLVVGNAENTPERVVLAYNKPVGIICSAANQGQENNSIIDAIGYPERIYPVGRLDKDSEGLILLTNDGELNDHIIRAANEHEKEYEVTVDRKVDSQFIEKMSAGVEIELKDGRRYFTRECRVKRTGENAFSIILTEGKNRQIRRMCEALGYSVLKLKRVRVMSILLGNLETGRYRLLTDREIEILIK